MRTNMVKLLRKHFCLLAVVSVIGLLSHTSASAQTVVFQDTFDGEPLGANVTNLANWTVSAGNVDVIGAGSGVNDFYPGNGRYLDMDGTCGNATIQTPAPLNLSPGTYQLSFEIGVNSTPGGFGGNALLVTLGSIFGQVFVAPAALTLFSAQFVIATPTAASLVFQELGPVDCRGSVLDDVQLLNITKLTVGVDIKPGSDPNGINPGSQGRIPVAILTAGTFDATTVDPSTVRFGATGTEAAPVGAALEDVDEDGDSDLILHFNTQSTGLQCGHTSATLTGNTFGGQAIQGTDSIKTAGCK